MIKLIDILKEAEEDLTFNGVRYVRSGKRPKLLQASEILYSYYDKEKYNRAPKAVQPGYVFQHHTDIGMSATSRLGEKGAGAVYVVNKEVGNYWECEELVEA